MTARVIDVRFDGFHGNSPVGSVKCHDHFNGVGIVEDESELVRVLIKIFIKHKVKVCFTAYDGLTAINLVKSSVIRPKVVLMDYRLFSMNGVDTMKEINKVDPEIRFIFLSADVEAKDEALKAGAIEFLKKPVSTKEIISAVNRALA